MSKRKRCPVYWYQLGTTAIIVCGLAMSIAMWNCIGHDPTYTPTFADGVAISFLQLVVAVFTIFLACLVWSD